MAWHWSYGGFGLFVFFLHTNIAAFSESHSCGSLDRASHRTMRPSVCDYWQCGHVDDIGIGQDIKQVHEDSHHSSIRVSTDI